MHYGIVGIGPVGATFAAPLHQAGHRVSVVDRNVHLVGGLAHRPLKVSGRMTAEARIEELHTEFDTFLLAEPDVILVCTKSCHSLPILKTLRAFGVPDRTAFVACQNGIDVEEQIADVFGDERAYRMILHMGCNYVRRGEVWIEFLYEHLLSQKGDNPVLTRIYEDFVAAGIPTRLTAEYKKEALRKALLNASLGSICALTHLTMLEVMQEEELLRMVRQFLAESVEIAKAMKIDLGDDYVAEALGYLAKGGDHKPSMLVDIEHRRMTENEHHAGKLFHYAEAAGIDVPVIQTVYYLMKNLERGMVLSSHVGEGTKGARA